MPKPAPITLLKRSVVFAKLRELGITKVIITFHGGGDEGDHDGIDLYHNDGDADVSLVKEMEEALLQPFYDQDISFDGDDLMGSIEWDCEEMKVIMHQQVMEWVDLPSEEI